MDGERFDDLFRRFSLAATRRGGVRALTGFVLAAPVTALLGLADSEAKKKRKRKKKKKCKGSTKKCGKKCIPSDDCCANADCGNGGSCVSGACTCTGGFKACNGACLPEADCCDAADCDDGDPCTQNVCNANGACSNPTSPDLTNCGGGKQCSGGVCAFPPTCQHAGPCPEDNPSFCCSNVCISVDPSPIGTCVPISQIGQPCLVSNFCDEGTCVGFVCTA
jgi:hypothetical protein